MTEARPIMKKDQKIFDFLDWKCLINDDGTVTILKWTPQKSRTVEICVIDIDGTETLHRFTTETEIDAEIKDTVQIPEEIDGKTVTAIGNSAFEGCESLRSIEIPASVTSIGDSAFAGCEILRSIEIPASVTSIGKCAFSGCYSLSNIKFQLPETAIGKSLNFLTF